MWQRNEAEQNAAGELLSRAEAELVHLYYKEKKMDKAQYILLKGALNCALKGGGKEVEKAKNKQAKERCYGAW